MERACFRFRTLEEAKNLAFMIANCFPDPKMAVYGLNEMLINAIEHGNLSISYEDKTRLVMEGLLFEEIARRLEMPEYRGKQGHLSFESNGSELRVHIKDEGKGFDWRPFLDISPERATHPHGRGIATSRLMSFTSVEYAGCGNEVICTLALSDAGDSEAAILAALGL
jgi:hypothetical protein